LRRLLATSQKRLLTSRRRPTPPPRKEMQMLRTRTATVVAASALAAGVATGAAGYAAVTGNGSDSPTASSATQTPTAASASHTAVGDIYEQTKNSVVEITVTSQVSSDSGQSPFPFDNGQPKQTQQAQGSGFVYDTDGHIVTNQHVVDGATSVKVTFANGK